MAKCIQIAVRSGFTSQDEYSADGGELFPEVLFLLSDGRIFSRFTNPSSGKNDWLEVVDAPWMKEAA